MPFDPADLQVLAKIVRAPRHHLTLQPLERTKLKRLWISRFIQLRPYDVWEATMKGRALYDAVRAEADGKVH